MSREKALAFSASLKKNPKKAIRPARNLNTYPKEEARRFISNPKARLRKELFTINVSGNRWIETWTYDGIQVILEIYGSKEANRANWVQVKEMKIVDDNVLNADQKQRARLIKRIYKALRTQFGDDLQNSEGELIRRFARFSDYDFGL